MQVKMARLSYYVVIVILAGCTLGSNDLDQVPITVGDTPSSNTGAIVGAYNLEDFQVSSDGRISGTLHLLLTKPMVPEHYRDVVFVEAYATYSSSELRSFEAIALGDPIPILPYTATSDQVDVNVQGEVALPVSTRNDLPLAAMTFKVTWYRVANVTETGLGGYWARLDVGQSTASSSIVGPFRVGETVDLVGGIDDQVRISAAHQRWLYENITVP